MPIKATVLSDNSVFSIGAIAERGWAVWLETPLGNYLFDTGQGKALLHNAILFGKDLTTARAVIISHHHLGHTGGLLDALRVMRGGPEGLGVPVHAHFDLFKESYHIPKGKNPRHAGIPFSRAALEGAGAIFYLENGWREIENGLYLTGEVPRQTVFEQGDANLKHLGEQGGFVTDPILDDQSLVIDTAQGLFVILGCSHAGIVNILNQIVEQTGRTDFHTVLGGTHLGPATEEQTTKTIEALLDFDIERIGVSHCTGPAATARLAAAFGDRFYQCAVGTEVEV